MQRKYRQKKYYCGEYLEVVIYPVYAKAKGRGKQSKPTTEIQQRLNQRHAEGKLRRLLHTNFTDADLFATLTFDDAHLPTAPENAQKLIQNFLRRLKRKYARLGINGKCIYVLEYGQKHNLLHAHLVLTGGITRADLEQLWGLGAVSVEALWFDFDGLATLAKRRSSGWNGWQSSCQPNTMRLLQMSRLQVERKQT